MELAWPPEGHSSLLASHTVVLVPWPYLSLSSSITIPALNHLPKGSRS